MTEAEFTQLLDRFQKGLCTPQEKEQLEQWLDSRREGASPFKSSSEKQRTKVALRESIYRKAEISRRRSVLFFPSEGRPMNVRLWFRVAASILIAVAVGYGLWKSDIMGDSLSIYKTEAGQKKTITLPDNTIVTLNGNSSLSYRDNWMEEKFRSVDLSGEAYFKVTSNAQKPFVVNTAGISIKVLGTTFNVKSYDEDEHIETTLVEGKVSIEEMKGHPAHEIIELSPDQKATFSKESKEIILERVKPESEAAWIRGSLVFENEPFSEIIKDLERLYGVKIFVKDKAALQCTFNIRLEGESLEEVLKLFSLSEDVKYRIQDHQAWIEGNLCDGKTN